MPPACENQRQPNSNHFMSSRPLVSILVRSMDRPTLQRALDSVAAQDYPDIEVVVVAAGAAPHRELPDRCGAFPLRLVRTAKPLARAEAANVALEAARGDWFNFLDDDDELLPMHVSTLRAALGANAPARLAHSISEDVAADGTRVGHHGAPFKPWRQLDTGFFRPHCAMFAASLLDDGASFDPRFDILEDMDFFIQCAAKTPFVFVPEVTTRYYVDAGDSGAGRGANLDQERIGRAIETLREKWADLDTRMRATVEFRAEQALWLIDNGGFQEAVPIVVQMLKEDPESADGRALRVLQLIARGDVEQAKIVLERIGHTVPKVDTIAYKLEQVRARMATRH
jgi:glycosyltransferase involved in cell wall biosynthesis